MASLNAPHVFLKMNSIFSLLTAAPLLLAAGLVAPVLFANPADWAELLLRALGVGLVGFAVLVYAFSKNAFLTRAMVNEIVFLDALWIICSIALITLQDRILTESGAAVVVVVAIVVAFFAVSQYVTAAAIPKPKPVADVVVRDGRLYATVKRTVDAPATIVWEVMTDHAGYAEVASNLSKVEVLSGEGLGMRRRCYGPKGENWEETCDLYEPGHSFGFRVHTEAEDYPYEFAELSGSWAVEELPSGSEIHIEIVALLKGNGLYQRLFAMLAKPKFKATLIGLADAWAERMERGACNRTFQVP